MTGLSAWIITDGGRHFKNDLVKDLTELLGVDRHITFPFCPWANGSVEVANSDLLWTIRGILSELRFTVDEWDLPLTLVTYVWYWAAGAQSKC